MKKRRVKAWVEHPFEGVDNEEVIIELDPEDDPKEIVELLQQTLYENHVSGGWAVLEEDEGDE